MVEFGILKISKVTDPTCNGECKMIGRVEYLNTALNENLCNNKMNERRIRWGEETEHGGTGSNDVVGPTGELIIVEKRR